MQTKDCARQFGLVSFVAAVIVVTGCGRDAKLAQQPLLQLSPASAELLVSPVSRIESAPGLQLKKGDRMCLVGNALGERLQHHNYWETLLHQRYPKLELVVRNLCFPGDEPFERIRSMNFGSPDAHLAHSKASVVLFFFGFNESFAGKDAAEKFKGQMHKLVEHTKQQNYSGKGPPRIVLISPIAFENTSDPNLPDGKEHNQRLEVYTGALANVATATGVQFVDLFHSTKQLFEKSEQRLTLNGAHLNAAGYRALAAILDRGLFGEGGDEAKINDAVKGEVDDKNFHWWHRYRAVNGYSIYGARGKAGSDGTYNNTDVMERERAILDQMTANRDQRIWAVAQGRRVPKNVDDSNTLAFINPKTNVGGPKDPNRARGKLGSLDYLSAEEQQKLFKLPPGYEINLVASEEKFPELANPVALNFDNKGRLWVSTMASYPHWKPKTPMDDKLLIFEDHNNDGVADECKVFAGGLHQPTGFEIGRGGAYVAQQPDILFLKDTYGDDVADVRIRQLVGFDSADSHHGIAAFEWGPDGGLYFQEGTFKFSQVESPYGLTRLHEAGVWRYDPRTEQFGVHVSFAFANPWGHVFDRWGQDFIADASPGNSYWAAPLSGYIEYPLKHPGGSQHRRIAAQTGGDPKYRFPTFYKKRTRPSAACELVSSRHFPPEAQGNFLLCNCIGDLSILQHKVQEDGSGFTGTEVEPLVVCKDGNFRPIDIQFAPDGSLYIVDWHNALIGHLQHNLREPHRDHSHGRIWRVTYKDRPLLEPPQIAGASIESLLDLLKKPEDRTRYRARRELASRDTNEVIAAVEQWVETERKAFRSVPEDKRNKFLSTFQHRLLEALWLYQTHNVVNEPLLKELLESPDHRARAAATRALSFWHGRVSDPLKLLAARINDDHPRARLEAVRACTFIHSPKSIEVALGVLDHEMDNYTVYTLNEALRVLDGLVTGSTTDHAHAHHEHGDSQQPKPLLFLDKSAKIVEFQLTRLASSRLLLIDRSADDAKYKPVFEAILLRAGMSRQDREEAAVSLSQLNRSSLVKTLLDAIASVGVSASVRRQLSSVLLKQPAKELSQHRALFNDEAVAENDAVRAVALAGLIKIGRLESAWFFGRQSAASRQSFLAGVSIVPSKKTRAALRDYVMECLAASQPVAVRRAAIEALAFVPSEQKANFQKIAPLVKTPPLRAAAVRTLLRIPKNLRPSDSADKVIKTLIAHAEKTPPKRRTTVGFLDAMQLADELLAAVSIEDARGYRDRLRELVVRVVRINTVNEEMRYDKPYFAVEAGRSVQLVLRNEDLMPHNLIICAPGTLRDVAQAAATLSPTIDKDGRQYVPKSKDVLFATRMVPSHRQEVFTFKAPQNPGEYPYVCTFPNHWMRMYGVMLVVKDLDAFLANPVAPADPLGIKRNLVQNWTMDDFQDELTDALQGRKTELGERLFKEATCLQCHKIGEQGGMVGPELAGVFKRHKNDDVSVLREILDPSHKIDPKYALYNIITIDGKVISGIVTSQNKKAITVISNPEIPKPQVIQRDDIDEMNKSSASLMPKGIMDRFTKDEILELLAYLKAASITSPSNK